MASHCRALKVSSQFVTKLYDAVTRQSVASDEFCIVKDIEWLCSVAIDAWLWQATCTPSLISSYHYKMCHNLAISVACVNLIANTQKHGHLVLS